VRLKAYAVHDTLVGVARELPADASRLSAKQINDQRRQAAEAYANAIAVIDDPETSTTARAEAYCDKRIALSYKWSLDLTQLGQFPDLTKYPHDNLSRTALPRCLDTALREIFALRMKDRGFTLDNSDEDSGRFRVVKTLERSPPDREDLRDGVALVYSKDEKAKVMTLDFYYYLKRAFRGYDYEPVRDETDRDVVALRDELNGVLGLMLDDIKGRCR
jgi:hypothetical protein